MQHLLAKTHLDLDIAAAGAIALADLLPVIAPGQGAIIAGIGKGIEAIEIMATGGHAGADLVCADIGAAIAAQETAAIETHGVAGIRITHGLTAGLGRVAHEVAAVSGERA